MKTKRLFVAVPVHFEDEPVILKQWMNDRELNANGIKWVKPANRHVTLVFLGDIPIEKIQRISEVVTNAFHSVEGFDSYVQGIGVFPSEKKPKVVWSRINMQSIRVYREKMHAALTQFGLDLDNRPFRPHLTLARVKFLKQRDAFNRFLKDMDNRLLGTVRIDRVVLYESILKTDGPVYNPVNQVYFH